MKCLWHYEWVKLPRNIVPEGKGVLGDWVRLASRAAFRKGTSLYCGYTNTVIPGMWAGGVVGLKSILGDVVGQDSERTGKGVLYYTGERKTSDGKGRLFAGRFAGSRKAVCQNRKKSGGAGKSKGESFRPAEMVRSG